MHRTSRGFTLIELLVVIAIIGMLATIATVALFSARSGARDTIRTATVNQIGRLLVNSRCVAPAGGPGDYDLAGVVDDYIAANPSAAKFVQDVPRDPKQPGGSAESGYRYVYDADGTCAVYANYEKDSHDVNLTGLSEPTAGGGTGTLRATAKGPNGTDLYYQFSR